MNKGEEANFTAIMRTGKQYEIDMAANTLEEKGIPYMRRQGSTGGLITAMPMTPTPGIGVWWEILVPEVAIDEAREVLSELPMEIQLYPDVLDFTDNKSRRKTIQRIAWASLALFALYYMLIVLIYK